MRRLSDGALVVIGTGSKNTAAADPSSAPVLDTRVSLPAFSGDALAAVRAVLDAVSAQRGLKVVPGTVPLNVLIPQQVTLAAAENVAARDVLQQIISQTGQRMVWTALYDADARMFAFNLRLPSRAQYDSFGTRRQVPMR